MVEDRAALQSDITSVAFGKEKPTSRSLVLSKINLMDTITTNIWKKTQRELKGYVYHKVKDKAMADDIVQASTYIPKQQ